MGTRWSDDWAADLIIRGVWAPGGDVLDGGSDDHGSGRVSVGEGDRGVAVPGMNKGNAATVQPAIGAVMATADAGDADSGSRGNSVDMNTGTAGPILAHTANCVDLTKIRVPAPTLF